MPTRIEKARLSLLRAEHAAAVSSRLKPLRLLARQIERAKVQHDQDRELLSELRARVLDRALEIEAVGSRGGAE